MKALKELGNYFGEKTGSVSFPEK